MILEERIRNMAYEFNSSETAMKYRLDNLNILRKVGDGKCYEPVDIEFIWGMTYHLEK